MKDNEKIFDDLIAPLLEQIFEIAKTNEIPILTAFQLKQDSENGVVVSINLNEAPDMISQFGVARDILAGKMSVMAVPVKEAEDLGLVDGVMTLLRKHAAECSDCRMKIAAAEAQGKTLSIKDFQHESIENTPEIAVPEVIAPTTVPEVVPEVVAAPVLKIASIKPAKPAKKIVNPQFSDFLNEFFESEQPRD